MEDEATRRRRKLSAIMMVDVCGFSRLMGKDEEKTVNLIRDFQERVAILVKQHAGRVVSTAGDSAFGEFDSVQNAMSCAHSIQETESRRNAVVSAEERVDARIGIHLGDVIVEDYQVYGDGVNIAARLEPIADPGGICISEAVYLQIRNRLDVPVQDLGLRELKNIEHPIHIYKIAPLTNGSAASADPAPAKETAPHRSTMVNGSPRSGLRSSILILTIVGAFLLMSEWLMFPTGGVLPTGGAVVLAVAAGKWLKTPGDSSAAFLIALGIALASGAVWTNWSRVTNVLFLMVGMIVAAIGVSKRDGRRQG